MLKLNPDDLQVSTFTAGPNAALMAGIGFTVGNRTCQSCALCEYTSDCASITICIPANNA